MPSWDTDTYLRFADERARPFADLTSRILATAPSAVVDLGCGTADLTAELAARWPSAQVTGVDSSPEMVARAQAQADRVANGRLSVVHADVRDWRPDAPVDVVVTNAVLQWVPGHVELLRRWVRWLAPGGWLALQVPANFTQPSHALMREVAARAPYAEHLGGVLRRAPVLDLHGYADVLVEAGCTVDAWETTYVHVLDREGRHGEDAVLEWIRGTGLRPVLDALAPLPDLRDGFVAEYAAALREAYPRRAHGTPLPFHRLFVVARTGQR